MLKFRNVMRWIVLTATLTLIIYFCFWVMAANAWAGEPVMARKPGSLVWEEVQIKPPYFVDGRVHIYDVKWKCTNPYQEHYLIEISPWGERPFVFGLREDGVVVWKYIDDDDKETEKQQDQ